MDNFREWISDNLRYILLGLAVILIIVVAVFAIKSFSGVGGGGTKQKESESQKQAVIVETESQSGSVTSGALVHNDPAILETVQKYYTALSNKDIETLSKMVESLDEKAQQVIMSNEVLESYNNIAVYSKDGPVEGSYVVFTYYQGKLVGIDTLVPSLILVYLSTNEDGSLYVADQTSDETVKAYIKNIKEESDVKELKEKVKKECQEVEEADPALKEMMDELAMPETESVLPDSDEAGVEANKLVQATEACRIRADSNTEAEIIGDLYAGDTITRIKTLDNGWSEVRLSNGVGYIRFLFISLGINL